jgi:PKD repeat protein
MDVIQEVWKRVAEDYAPFDVNVTTEDPGQDAMTRSSLSDQNYGTRALITAHDSRLCSSCGGVAYVGVYDVTGDHYQPAFVFHNKLSGNAKYIAEATSHEVGHNLGLSHDGTSTVGYYQGHGAGETSWSPIMGVGYYTQLSQWSKGEYNDANQHQDDIVVIQQNGVLLATDDHSNTLDAGATALSTRASTTAGMNDITAIGIISTPSDQDVFRFDMGAGDVLINVSPATVGTNLDVNVSLYTALGQLLQTSNPLEQTSASITLQGQPAGSYYLKIEGAGKGEALAQGYTDYGSLGQFIVSGMVPETSDLKAPIAIISPVSAQGNAPLAVSFNASDSYDADGNITGYQWSFGDNGITSSLINPSHVFNAPADYSVALSVTDNDGLTGTTSTLITIENQPPIAVASATTLAGEAPLLIDFSSTGSFDPDATHTLRYAWNFGDGSSATNENPSHSYANAGDYIATLTVTDNLGASATDSIHLTISPNLNSAPIAPSSLVANVNVTGKGKNKTRSLLLSWVDHSENEDSFVVERCQETGRGKLKSCLYNDLITLSANVTSYTSTINKGVFKYKVKAVNSFGSNTSNEVKLKVK